MAHDEVNAVDNVQVPRRRGLHVVASEPLPKIFIDSARIATSSAPPLHTAVSAPGPCGSTGQQGVTPSAGPASKCRNARRAAKREKQRIKRKQLREANASEEGAATAAAVSAQSAPAPRVDACCGAPPPFPLVSEDVEDAAIRVAASQTGVSPRVIRKLMQKRGVTVQSLLHQFTK